LTSFIRRNGNWLYSFGWGNLGQNRTQFTFQDISDQLRLYFLHKPKRLPMTGVPSLDSLRINLACEVTDNIQCWLPLSTHHGLYRMLMTVEATATVVLARASSKPASSKDSIARHPSGHRDRPGSGRRISRKNSLRSHTSVKTTILPGTGSGRVDLVSLRDRARNEQAAVAA
jgi:hypothetical protein